MGPRPNSGAVDTANTVKYGKFTHVTRWGPGPGAPNPRFARFSADFRGFWGILVSGGFGGPGAFTQLSFSPNGGFPTPFVPDSMFSGRFWPRYVACLNSQQAVVASQQPQYAVVAQQQPLCGCHTACVAATQPLCGFHTDHAVRCRRHGRPGRCPESLEALPPPPHAHTPKIATPRCGGMRIHFEPSWGFPQGAETSRILSRHYVCTN